jgi:hypothetical protein
MAANNWPNDADGDVFRRMDSKGFDFSKACTIDFNIDFDHWPPSEQAIKTIQEAFPGAVVHEDKEECGGYVLFQITTLLTYDFVMETQDRASRLMAGHGGKCDSWGVLH